MPFIHFVVFKQQIDSLSESSLDAYLLLRYWVDRRESPDLHWYRCEFVVERGEHAPGPAGLLHTRLETPDADGDGALHCCHRLLVVRRMLGGILFSTMMVNISVSLFSLPVFRWLPESARWLLAHGRVEEAKKYLVQCAKINRKSTSKLDTEVQLTDTSW